MGEALFLAVGSDVVIVVAASNAGTSPSPEGTPASSRFAVEEVVKVLDACGFNAHYWVFGSGLTDVETTIRVRDTWTGATQSYFKPLGQPFRAILDTEAFSGCP